jgi:hypothetical protein
MHARSMKVTKVEVVPGFKVVSSHSRVPRALTRRTHLSRTLARAMIEGHEGASGIGPGEIGTQKSRVNYKSEGDRETDNTNG